MKTRSLDRHYAKDYLKRAEECKNSMKRSLEAEEWNGCVISAIHCAISSADALCIWKKGLRNASENHTDALALLNSIDPNSEDIKRAVRHLSALLQIKSDAEYGNRLLNRGDAESAVKHAERIFDFAKSEVMKSF